MSAASVPRHRKRLRLPTYDYAQPGAYFVTICVEARRALFGPIVNGRMQCNELGKIVTERWADLPRHYPQIALDAFVVMPNHIHGIIVIQSDDDDRVGAGLRPAPTASANNGSYGLPEFVHAFKSFSSRSINEYRHTPGASVWQRSYYEHVIRSERNLVDIRAYVEGNPARWASDSYFQLDC